MNLLRAGTMLAAGHKGSSLNRGQNLKFMGYRGQRNS